MFDLEEAKFNSSVVALGKFEGLHKGHMLLIDRVSSLAREKGCASTVLTIEFPADKVIYTASERCHILESYGIQSLVRCPFTKEFASIMPLEFFKEILIKKLGAKYIVVGSDFCFGCNRKGNVDTLKEFGIKYGVELVVIDKLKIDDTVVSSSLIRDFIERGDIVSANRFLGRSYSVSGKVALGRRLGHTLGFPTANIIPENDKLLPMFGVYRTEVTVAGKSFAGLTNIGDNPTVSKENNVTVETYIKDFDRDIYGSGITVNFTGFIRPEIKFSSLDELVTQINNDLKFI